MADNTAAVPKLPRRPVLPLDETQYALRPDELEFFKSQTGIQEDDALKAHILRVQEEAYRVHPYRCIRNFSFAKLIISRFPAYQNLLRLGKERPGAILVDVGCCFGNDVRKAVSDGYPAQNVLATDLVPEFWDLGHKLFCSTPETFPVVFIGGNVFDNKHLESIDPFTSVPETSAPSLPSLTSLNPLRGHVSAVHAAMVFHLFDEASQFQLARALACLLSPEPGSMIFGIHIALPQKGLMVENAPDSRKVSVFCHSPESWVELWDGQVFEKGSVKVETRMVEVNMSLFQANVEGGRLWLLQWSVTRL